jgi:hypothetical protein
LKGWPTTRRASRGGGAIFLIFSPRNPLKRLDPQK